MIPFIGFCQDDATEGGTSYKKKVLDTSTLELLGSYYTQDGSHAAVSGGKGTEELTDIHPIIIMTAPLNEDDILTIDFGISAYTSASSSNVDPFDSDKDASPFQASSGASQSDTWLNLNAAYSHSSDDRNKIWSAHISVASEYDYFSAGVGAGYTWLLNEKNSELSVKVNALFDTWNLLYPSELRPFRNGNDLNDPLFLTNTITGNANYSPSFASLQSSGRNSYSAGFGISQILSKRIQGSLNADFVLQDGQLSTPFQRVYFADVEDSFIQGFHLADDIERLPSTRTKIALGTMLNFYLNQWLVLRTHFRYYTDDWGIGSNTASLTAPIKVSSTFTIYPSYRYYVQSASDYFAAYNEPLSTDEFYTSDYDLSDFSANRYGFGISYSDIFRKFSIRDWGMEKLSLKYHYYERNADFNASTISFGLKFIHDKKASR